MAFRQGIFFLVFFTSLWIYSHDTSAQSPVVVIKNDTFHASLNEQLRLLVPQKELSIQEVAAKRALAFRKMILNSHNGEIKPETIKASPAVWAYLIIHNQSDQVFQGILTTGIIDHAELYYPRQDNSYSTLKSGRLIPTSERDFAKGDYKKGHFKITIPSSASIKIFIKHYSAINDKRSFDVRLESLEQWELKELKTNNRQSLFMGIVIGFMGIMALYNLLVFFFGRDKIYLYYTAYIVFPLIYILTVNGVLTNTFVGNSPLLYLYIRALVPPLTLITYLLFARSFLDIPKTLPKWDRYFKLLITAEAIDALFVLIAVPLIQKELIFRTIPSMLHLVVLIFIVVLLIIIIKKGTKIALYFASGAVCFIGGAIFLNLVGLLKFTDYQTGISGQIIGIALELVIYSLGLGYRIKVLEKEKRQVQEENAQILADQNKTLEEQVKVRTREIEQQKEEMQTQNEELFQQQEEIIAQRDYIEEQNGDLRHKNEQITSSIRYAKTIQQALLPFKERIVSQLNDHFIIYRPKDIVSGDFYWFEQVENKRFLAVVDCTGHGVPGAFMSMVGISILNDIVIKKKVLDPSQILTELNDNVKEALKQNEASNRDGMDLAFCMMEDLPDQQVRVTFSGAKRPLYYVVNGESTLREFKGDRCSIGGYHARKVVFTNQEIILPKHSCLYFTTDGITDQHNAKNKKLGSARLKKVIERIHSLPFSSQAETLNEIIDIHQKTQIQRDDITMIGLQL